MRKGFTLVEIMVVIVIMGVLAAIGVPKLFGQIAKAKASEVPTAAGTYVRLQEAYQSEKTIIGSWKNIGYSAPGINGISKEFQYSGCLEDDIPFTGEELTVIGWKATNRNSLNLCGGHQGTWAVQVSAVAERTLNYANMVNLEDCGNLTVNWAIASISEECEGTQQQANNEPETPSTPDSSEPEEQITSSASQNDEPEASSASQNDVCSNGTPCSNDDKCNRGNSGKDKDVSQCSKSQFSGCCFCCP